MKKIVLSLVLLSTYTLAKPENHLEKNSETEIINTEEKEKNYGTKKVSNFQKATSVRKKLLELRSSKTTK